VHPLLRATENLMPRKPQVSGAATPAPSRESSSSRRFRPEISFCPQESPFEPCMKESVLDSDAHAIALATCAATAELLRAIYLL
jgi:hypothetical protein